VGTRQQGTRWHHRSASHVDREEGSGDSRRMGCMRLDEDEKKRRISSIVIINELLMNIVFVLL
jgi:hypothetical protein